MERRTRLFQFPDGMLERQAYEDDTEEDPGFYLELRTHVGLDEVSDVSMSEAP